MEYAFTQSSSFVSNNYLRPECQESTNFEIYFRRSKHKNYCFLCVCLQNDEAPITLNAIWKKIGDCSFLHNLIPNEQIKVEIRSETIFPAHSHICNSILCSFTLPMTTQSLAKSIKCHLNECLLKKCESFGYVTFKKFSSDKTLCEVLLKNIFINRSFQKESCWTVDGLFELASLYGHLNSSFHWNLLAENLGFTKSDIDEFNYTLIQTFSTNYQNIDIDDEDNENCEKRRFNICTNSSNIFNANNETIKNNESFTNKINNNNNNNNNNNSNECFDKLTHNPITPKRIFCLLLCNFQKHGGTLNEFANALHITSNNMKMMANNTFQSSCIKNTNMLNSFLPRKIHGLYNPRPINRSQEKNKLPLNNSQIESDDSNHIPHDKHSYSKTKRSYNDFREHDQVTKISDKIRLDQNHLIYKNKQCFKHARRRHSLPKIHQNIVPFNTDFNYSTEFNTPIKRMISTDEIKLPDNIIPDSPAKRTRLENKNTIQQIDENKRMTLSLKNKHKIRRHLKNFKENQTLLPNFWYPHQQTTSSTSISSVKTNTEYLLKEVHQKIEQTKKETEKIQNNFKIFLEKFHSETNTNPSTNWDVINSKSDQSDQILNDLDLWNLTYLFPNSSSPKWENLIKICNLTEEFENYSREFPYFFPMNTTGTGTTTNNTTNDERLIYYLILLNWVEKYSNPSLNFKPTLKNLFQLFKTNGYEKFTNHIQEKMQNSKLFFKKF